MTPPASSAVRSPQIAAAEYAAANRAVFGVEPPGKKRWLNFPFEWGTPEAQELQALIWAIEMRMIRKHIETLVADGVAGDLLEFGVSRGNSLSQIARFAQAAKFPGNIYGFDSFEGLPELTEGDREGMWHKGQFAADYEEALRLINPSSDPKIKLVKGWFNDTLSSDAISNGISKVAFARIDCDLYQSAVECLAFIEPRLVSGALINFDDWTDDIGLGETRAFFEFAQRNAGKWRFEMLARISLGGMHIRVR